MVTAEQSLVTGFKLIYKNKIIFAFPLVWELFRALLVTVGLNLGGWWPVEPRFYLVFTMPRSWPALDYLLPQPVTGPSLAHLARPDLGLEPFSDLKALALIVILTVIGAYLKGGFLGLVKNALAGQELNIKDFLEYGIKFFNRFLKLGLILLLAEGVYWWYMFPAAKEVQPVIILSLISGYTLIHLVMLFTSVAIVFQDLPLWDGVKKSWTTLRVHGRVVIPFVLYGALVNGLVAIPLNWAVSTVPGLLGAAGIYAIVGSGLAAGLMYLYSGVETFFREG
ncbi:MAG: hypothetical protein M0Z31_07585 [Clostridia bacterium]|nr:hypothetical protein [Clostridia bacterium]